ncbi:hypothetical protein Pryu01_02435 [Paraliobacillus ryukyuensis]|uniref:Uncharacterized protein n=1 Tax=Paraliobacillus ryukyuensis TaxID=200904 RepID=A0A366DWP2_9BACI|nr:hypothetical protein [Paraliobacillus ryukyuensis]RBO93578.1 hypothetical protein DES48_11189 [Paraliobacillus ryukyuensis]
MVGRKRIEIQFDEKKERDVIDFLENEIDNKAGFIKTLVRDYVRYKHSINKADSFQNNIQEQQAELKEHSVNDDTRKVSQFLIDFFHKYS